MNEVNESTPVGDLRAEISELRAKVDRYEKERRFAGKTVVRAGGLGALIFLSPKLATSIRNYLVTVRNARDPLPPAATAEVLAAVVRRFVKVASFGLVIGLVPIGLLVWQNVLVRAQTDQVRAQTVQFTQDARIARRAQLIDIIYSEECESPLEVLQRLDHLAHERTGSDTNAKYFRNRICQPGATTRARSEAILSFAALEKGTGKLVDLSHAPLDRANLFGADLSDADLSLARLEGANLAGANLFGADLSRANLSRANLSDANLSDANLSDANLQDANLKGADLSRANLSDANLSKADLKRGNLSDSNLFSADLSGANLHDANLTLADLTHANLSRAFLGDVRLWGTHLFGADLSDANLQDANLVGAPLIAANGNATTVLPKGVERPSHWRE